MYTFIYKSVLKTIVTHASESSSLGENKKELLIQTELSFLDRCHTSVNIWISFSVGNFSDTS